MAPRTTLVDVNEVVDKFEGKGVADLKSAISERVAQFYPMEDVGFVLEIPKARMDFDARLHLANHLSTMAMAPLVHRELMAARGVRKVRRSHKSLWETKVDPVLKSIKEELCKAAHDPWEEYTKSKGVKELVQTLASLILKVLTNPPAWLLACLAFVAYYLVKLGLPKYCGWK